MRAYASTLKLVGAKIPERRSPRQRAGPGTVIELRRGMVPFAAVERLSRRLQVPGRRLLDLIALSRRTATRRKQKGFLEPEEADRLLRVARLVERATRIFGSEDKASRWLNTAHPMLGDAPPVALLDSDAGAQLVSDELTRIDFGDFA
jgi:putative toxin-antitoxin system antitoxin component (TIGR02293 family)